MLPQICILIYNFQFCSVKSEFNMFSNFASRKNNYFSLGDVQFQIPELKNEKTASRSVCRSCSDSAIIIVSSAYSKV